MPRQAGRSSVEPASVAGEAHNGAGRGRGEWQGKSGERSHTSALLIEGHQHPSAPLDALFAAGISVG
jgi:hypothetical protein